jgi:hypothetical protein
MPTDYVMEATAFHTSCQCWVKHYPHTTRSPDEPYGTRQEEKRRAVKGCEGEVGVGKGKKPGGAHKGKRPNARSSLGRQAGSSTATVAAGGGKKP